MHFLWGMGQMANSKFILVVDSDVDLRDMSMVAWKAFNNVDAARDVVLSQGPLDVLDHSSPSPRYGTRMGIDATRKLPEEGAGRPWPDELRMDEEVKSLVEARWREYGL
jgi:4-hydroxy-3-polyprenylbenzoate decarboxylase